MRINFLKKSQLLFIMSFAALIVLGAILLEATVLMDGRLIAPVDALFMSASAVCVTGLTTLPTSSFNIWGQLLLLLLMQAGGVGVMTLTSSVILLVRREMNLDNRMLISGVLESFSGRELAGLLRVILLYTFAIEAAGAVLLALGFWLEMKHPLPVSLYYGLFHSVSAFCNAGFSTFDDSLMRAGPFIKLVVSTQIVLGGLGFYVIYDLHQVFMGRGLMRLHTKLVLTMAGILIVGGMIFLKMAEGLGNSGLGWLDALFQSVTARTAGFNTVDMSGLHPSGILIIILLMLVGAAPGSTGGGMKTTTVALVSVALYKTFVGERHVTLAGRQIPATNVLKAFSIMFLFIILTVLAVHLILIYNDKEPLYVIFFEAVSALCTVGLSLGLTAKAAVETKLVLIACMFLGRIGPLTFFIFLLAREKASRLEYPEERLIMG